ncbi:MAG: phytoene/squalene synthase family protein [Chloroflexota bacterium]|nr:phytoene/squalene synthase family protein [Chloroflexota bacterium]MDE2961056.1 phytoene/squalene synthase family protein [Chloroflexota bacterium]
MTTPLPTASSPSPEALAAAYEECRRVTRREARNFYFAFLTLPARQRRAIYVAYTFCRYCDDSVDAEGTHAEKLQRIERLRDMLAAAYAGTANQPLFIGLADMASTYGIPQEYFQEVLSGVESDLVKTRFANFEELRGYCYQVASVVGLICIHIFGYRNGEEARRGAIDLGLAMQLTNICRDVLEDWEFGRVYLPQDEMLRFGVTESDLGNRAVTDGFANLMQFQIDRAREYFASGRGLLTYLPPRSRACPAALGLIYGEVLNKIEAAGYDVFRERISLSKGAKLGLMARAWLTGPLMK